MISTDEEIRLFSKKRKQTTRVSKTLRISIWDMYAGPNNSGMKCMTCNRVELNRTQVKSYEAGHIVAETFHTKKPCRFDLIPMCPACNNQCSDICVFDYLLARERYKVLSKIIRAIYHAFEEQNPSQFKDEFNSEAWRVLQHFYGGTQFLAGGGLQNERQIYNIAKKIQCEDEWKKIEKYSRKLKESTEIVSKCSKRIKLEKKF